MKGVIKLSYKLEKLKKDLAQAVNNPNTTKEELIEISSNIDSEIEKSYIKNITPEDKYKKYIDKTDRKKIILQIRSNLEQIYYNISTFELDILSENIYDYCCLMVHKIPKQDIIRYILEKGTKYYNKLSEEEKSRMTIEPNIRIFKALIKKYSKILESNKES